MLIVGAVPQAWKPFLDQKIMGVVAVEGSRCNYKLYKLIEVMMTFGI